MRVKGISRKQLREMAAQNPNMMAIANALGVVRVIVLDSSNPRELAAALDTFFSVSGCLPRFVPGGAL